MTERRMRIAVERVDNTNVIKIAVLVDEVIVLKANINEQGPFMWRAPPGGEIVGAMLDEVYVNIQKDTQYRTERTADGIKASPWPDDAEQVRRAIEELPIP